MDYFILSYATKTGSTTMIFHDKDHAESWRDAMVANKSVTNVKLKAV